MYVSKPRAALIQIFEKAEVSNVGNQRLSRVSISRKTTSCDLMSVSMVSTSFRAFSMASAVGMNNEKWGRMRRGREGGRGREEGGREGEREKGEGERRERGAVGGKEIYMKKAR